MLIPPALKKVLKQDTLDLVENELVTVETVLNHIEENYDVSSLIDQLIDNMNLEDLIGGQIFNCAVFLRSSGEYDGIRVQHRLQTKQISECVYEAEVPNFGDIITGFAFPTFSHIKKFEIISENSPYICERVQTRHIGMNKIKPFVPRYPSKVHITLDEEFTNNVGSQIVVEYVLTVGLNRILLHRFGNT